MLAQQSNPFWEQFLIVDQNGFTLYSDYHYNDDHERLIGGLFRGVERIFRIEFNDVLQGVKGIKYHASVIKRQVNSNNLLFIGLTRAEICEKKRRKELEFVTNQFIKEHHAKITSVFDRPDLFKDFKKTPKTRKESALTHLSSSLQFNPKCFSPKIFKQEIKRIRAFLKLPTILGRSLYKRTKKVYEIIGSRSKFKNVKKLVPLVLFLYCFKLGIVIDRRELINVSHITEKELQDVIFQLKNYTPEDN